MLATCSMHSSPPESIPEDGKPWLRGLQSDCESSPHDGKKPHLNVVFFQFLHVFSRPNSSSGQNTISQSAKSTLDTQNLAKRAICWCYVQNYASFMVNVFVAAVTRPIAEANAQ